MYSLVRELELKRLMKEVVEPEYEACGKFSYSLRALEFGSFYSVFFEHNMKKPHKISQKFSSI